MKYGDGKARVMLVVEDTRQATDLLWQKGFTDLDEREKILAKLENKPGALKSVTGLPAARGINRADLRDREHGEISRAGRSGDQRQPAAIVALKKAVVR